jgi:AcrR family transcriptional regulator
MTDDIITNYREARARTREALHRGVLDAASRILVSEGFGALTVRRVADEVGASTKVIYTLFENKEGLVNALFMQGVQRLRAALEAVPAHASPLERLMALLNAYRQHALAYPNDYLIMYGLSLPDFRPTESAMQENMASWGFLIEALEAARDAGLLATGEVESAGKILFALMNGMISLQLGGYLAEPDAARFFHDGVATILRGMASRPDG